MFDTYNMVISYLNVPEQTLTDLKNKREDLLEMLILYQVLASLLIFIGCVIFTHRIAGPLFKLKKHLQEFRNEGLKRKLVFRKGDFFHDVADEVNETLEIVAEDFSSLREFTNEANLPEEKKRLLEKMSKKLPS